MSNKDKRESPIVKAVLALDNYLSELERVGTKINSTDLTADFDIDYIQKLMARFAECGQGIAEEVTNLSKHLQEAQTKADAMAQQVGRQADLFNVRRNEQNEKLEQFRVLGERVRDFNTEISRFRDDPTQLKAKLPAVEAQLADLVQELESLRQAARESKMRPLEKSVESLVQSLQAARKKLRDAM
ncbi:MAG TPA: hypothetical protein VKY31_14185 [Terriglobia bacterium]|nr:hypothetical protein [Terriglobia bacterium]